MNVFVLLAALVACAGAHPGGHHHAAFFLKQGPPVFKTAPPPAIPLKGAHENIVLSAELYPAHDHPLPAAPKMHGQTFIILKQGHPAETHGGAIYGNQIMTHGSVGGGIGKAHAVAGPSYLVSTVHHVQKVSQGGKYLGSIDGHAHDAWPSAGGLDGKILVKGGPIPAGHGGGW
ncbi:uncharacterized protein LOC100904250 [Galendromus occidentalis]|uniref:Uncharacterized protein LOC100904250 n=1 Tax=Galendromus occidentalis TaxID=34638 RepID=A0AAJ6QM82_9ACAR|nr:uncharacterized protein LOC100904250 [Galendromus occidentalis]